MPLNHPIMAIDPGRNKCGLAVIYKGRVLLQEIVARDKIVPRVGEVLTVSGPIVIGDRTGSKDFSAELKAVMPALEKRIVLVDEHLSSVEARTLYWEANPAKGWRKFLPISLQVPPVPIDDFVAVILAKRYVANLEAE